MKIFMTGGTGFLGLHLATELSKRGHEVTNYGRRTCEQLAALGVRQVEGDLANPAHQERLEQALAHQQVCFHVASKVAMWGRWDDFYRTNVTGTEHLIKACHAQGVKHFIYTSTPSVVFHYDSLCGADETLPYPSTSYGLYAQSKIMAERFVLSERQDNFHVVALRPHMIFGPGDQNIIPGLLKAADEGRLAIIGDGDNLVDVTYVANAVDAHLCALDRLMDQPDTISGRAFFIGQGPVKLWDFINDLLRLYGRRPVTKKIPFPLAFALGAVSEFFYKMMGRFHRDPKMTRFVALQLAKSHYYDHGQAEALLGWRPRVTLQEALDLERL